MCNHHFIAILLQYVSMKMFENQRLYEEIKKVMKLVVIRLLMKSLLCLQSSVKFKFHFSDPSNELSGPF